MNQKKLYKLMCALAVSAVMGSGALAEDDSNAIHAGLNTSLQLGPSFTITNGSGTAAIFGVSTSYHLKDNFEFGVELDNTSIPQVPSASVDGNYFLNEGLFIGIQAGVNLTSGATGFIGPQAGYDYFVSKNESIGAEVQYLIGTASGSSSQFGVIGTVKYYF